jgi:hypothetical protein
MWQPEPEEEDEYTVNHAKESISGLEEDESTLSTFRLLMALLQHAPTKKGRHAIATDIIYTVLDGDWPESLIELADHYYASLLLPSNSYLFCHN